MDAGIFLSSSRMILDQFNELQMIEQVHVEIAMKLYKYSKICN